MSKNEDEALPLAKYPTCSWTSDAFTNWLTQNAVNLSSNLAFGLLGIGSSTANSASNIYNNKKMSAETKNIAGEMLAVQAGINVAGVIANQIRFFLFCIYFTQHCLGFKYGRCKFRS